ncbi:hypothetical protein QFC24_004102 [Naganishia onofrii]|uniref:Uncharacterized protein n=1 Tax=Naganishia onofrii TaxID=1851511 RepID=A0ACC2XGC1_9TREE|nr:hypothetical protein QFC24_004102 [Naganishia onofrii]
MQQAEEFTLEHYLNQYNEKDDSLFGKWCNISPDRPSASQPNFEWSPQMQSMLGYRYSVGDYGDMKVEKSWNAVAGRAEDLGQGAVVGVVDPEVVPDGGSGVQAVMTADLIVENGANKHGAPRTPSYATSHQTCMPTFLPPATPLVIAHMKDVAEMQNKVTEDTVFNSTVPASPHAMANYVLAAPPAPEHDMYSPSHEDDMYIDLPDLGESNWNDEAETSAVQNEEAVRPAAEPVIVSVRWKYPPRAINRRLAYDVQTPNGICKTTVLEKMHCRYDNASDMIKAYWEGMRADTRTMTNIQEHLFITDDFSSCIAEPMIHKLEREQRDIIQILVNNGATEIFQPDITYTTALRMMEEIMVKRMVFG